MNIFVAKLSASTTNEDLQGLFEEYGEVSSAKVIFDRETGYSKRFGFVEMSNDDEALKAIDELNECEFDNSQIVVKKARPRSENSNQGGGGGRRRDYNNRY
ncbi:MAG: RNA-binding protein [Bacteroidetes bacterium]|jgi:RNA recognition motif-containing protein|nr:RNA-binding protein [Bacteroidota bacterium]